MRSSSLSSSPSIPNTVVVAAAKRHTGIQQNSNFNSAACYRRRWWRSRWSRWSRGEGGGAEQEEEEDYEEEWEEEEKIRRTVKKRTEKRKRGRQKSEGGRMKKREGGGGEGRTRTRSSQRALSVTGTKTQNAHPLDVEIHRFQGIRNLCYIGCFIMFSSETPLSR